QGSSPYVFVTEAGTPVTPAWFLQMIQRTGVAAKLAFQVHPHMLRHSTGYKLANDGQDTRSLAHYLGHRNLQSTARYTALAPRIGSRRTKTPEAYTATATLRYLPVAPSPGFFLSEWPCAQYSIAGSFVVGKAVSPVLKRSKAVSPVSKRSIN